MFKHLPLTLTYTLPQHLPLFGLLTALAAKTEVKTDAPRHSVHSWYDTFDWKLFRKKRSFTCQDNKWVFQDFQGRQLLSWSAPQNPPLFFKPSTPSPLPSLIQDVIGIRALMQLAKADVTETTLSILNRNKKTVASLHIQEIINNRNGRHLTTLTLREVRGYAKKLQQTASLIENHGATTYSGAADTLDFVLQDSGRTPLDYSSSYNVPLQPSMNSGQAVTAIYSSLLKSIEQNEQGIIADIDSEFLHDLRVAVRRTRSALSLTRGVLSAELFTKVKQEFRYIGQLTNPVRDLDVYLLCEDKYKNRLPERLQEGLVYFFEDLRRKRNEEQGKLIDALQGPHYKMIITDWREILESDTGPASGASGSVPIGTLAEKIIRKWFRRVLRDGNRIHSNTPDSGLHRLRIECKKLRYSLEFFSSLYNQVQMKQLISQLKELQNNLGDFNDLSVQQAMLADTLSTIRPGSKKSRETAASLGGLMTGLSLQHQGIRGDFEKTFARFASKKNVALFHNLFTNQTS